MIRSLQGRVLGPQDLMLVAKILDAADDAFLIDEGFTAKERSRVDALFEDLNALMVASMGYLWHTEEVQ